MGPYNGPIWAGLVFESRGVIRTVTDCRDGRVFFDSVHRYGKDIGSFSEQSDFFRRHVTKLLPPPNGDWSTYVPKDQLPDTGPKEPKLGEIWAFNNGAFKAVGRYKKEGVTTLLADTGTLQAGTKLCLYSNIGYSWAVRLFEASETKQELKGYRTSSPSVDEPFGIKVPTTYVDLDEPVVPTGTMPPNRSEWRVMADLLDKGVGELYLGAAVKGSELKAGGWYFLPSMKGNPITSRDCGAVIRVKKTGRKIVTKILALMNDSYFLDTNARHRFVFTDDSAWGNSGWRPILAFPERSLYATTEPKTPEAWKDLAAFLASNTGDPPWLGRPVTNWKFEEDQLYFCVPKAGELFGSRDEATAPRLVRVTDVGAERVKITYLAPTERSITRFYRNSIYGELAWRPVVRLPRPEQYTVKASEPVISEQYNAYGEEISDPETTCASPPIKMGDVVRLVIGGPKMVVTGIGSTGEYAPACWFEGRVLKEHVFPVVALIKE